LAVENATLVATGADGIVVTGAEVVLLVGVVVVPLLVVEVVALGVVAGAAAGVAAVLVVELVDEVPLVAASLESPHAESRPVRLKAKMQQRALVILITVLTKTGFNSVATF
jgi:hypothetical protein